MESLYQIDQFVANADDRENESKTNNNNLNINNHESFMNNQTDPYSPKSTSSGSPRKSYEPTFRERSAMQDLAIVDKQVEQYAISYLAPVLSPTTFDSTADNDNSNDENNVFFPNNNDNDEEKEEHVVTMTVAVKGLEDENTITTKNNNNIIQKIKKGSNELHNDLYAVDLEMDHQKQTMKDMDDIQSIVELYSMDQEVEKKFKSTPIFDNEGEYDTFQSLVNMDTQVDGHDTTTTTTSYNFIDPITELIMREYGTIASSSVGKCWNVKDIMDLVMTDHFVDGIQQEKDIHKEDEIIQFLHSVDRDVDDRTHAALELKEMEQIIDLYHMDQDIEAKSGAPTSDLSTKKTRKNGGRKYSVISFTGLDLPKPIADLYLTDLDVEGRTNTIEDMEGLDSILDLYETDCEVDGTKYRVCNNETNDYIFKELYRMDQIVDQQDGEKLKTPVFEDRFTKTLMEQYVMQSNELKQNSSVEEVFDLFTTDLEVNGHNSHLDEMAAIEPLLKVDLEMNAASDCGHAKETMKDVLDLLKVDIEIELMQSIKNTTKSLTKKTIAATEPPVSRTKTNGDSDEMDAIMHLYHTDLEVSQAKYDSSFNSLDASIYQDLWMMDVQVDKSSGGHEGFKDPFTKSMLKQYTEESNAAASSYDNGICEILDLISNDMRIGAAISHKDAMMFEEDIMALHHVDEEIEKLNQKAQARKLQQPQEHTVPESESVASSAQASQSTPQKRSIFSQKEKTAAAVAVGGAVKKSIKPDSGKKAACEQRSKVDTTIPSTILSKTSEVPTQKNETPSPTKKKRSIFSKMAKIAARKTDVFKKK